MAVPTREPSPAFLSEYDGYKLINTAIAFIVLEIIFVALRLWVRRMHRSKFGWDDYLILPSLVFCVGPCILGILAVQHGGVGRHIQYVEQFPDKVKYWYQSCLIAVPLIYMMASSFPKLAILAVYLEVFVDKFSRVSCWVLVFIVGGNAIANIPPLIYKCDPISFGWDKSIPGGWCANAEPRLQFASLSNIITDFAMILLPIPMMWRLQVNRATKVGLACTFATGNFGLVASCLRISNFFSTAAFLDGTWASVDLVIWCIVEPGTYLLAACFIAFRPLVTCVWRETRLVTKLSRSHRPSYDNSETLRGSLEMHKAGKTSQRLTDSDVGSLEREHAEINTVEALAERRELNHHGGMPGIRVEREFTWSSQEEKHISQAV